ncbi:Helix-turn-helix domain-containing protein [Maridesulfovibrio ferrireducens]|uniref:Helix-turn-helix domain-containing protein n=1 Tax=Maridesulfovibrio ferrireducens TaxID=246191 RepID=A0A1G9D3W3_9BACT|nr:AraC family transcriptional regulator [Maridesulfovibrio ferrireducens]SDK58581.1 Helix-turn-helix domain-containing protein [Maridesulfovibrio ferrireducens]
MINELINILNEMTPSEGCTNTFLEKVTIFRLNTHSEKKPLIYDQCICFMVQGKKVGHLSDKTISYDSNHFLVVPVIVPFECEVFASADKPVLGITISIDYAMVQEIVDSGVGGRDDLEESDLKPGTYLESLNDEMIETLIRLLKNLKNQEEAQILGPQTLREIFYRTLLGEHGYILASAARGESSYAKVANSLRAIHNDYSASLDVPQLAGKANMSVRTFYDHFKAVTSYTPVQYLKRIRLEKARQFIVSQRLQASETARMVGYESASQFSREFKRHFGYSPTEAPDHAV